LFPESLSNDNGIAVLVLAPRPQALVHLQLDAVADMALRRLSDPLILREYRVVKPSALGELSRGWDFLKGD
jgi:hypothetical protein